MALPFLVSSFLIPLVGMYTDKKGKRVQLLILSAGIGILTYIMFITFSPLLPLISLGKNKK